MGRIKQTDVSEQDVYGLVTASADKLDIQLKEVNTTIIKQTKAVKKLGAELDKLSQKGIDNVIKKRKTLNDLTDKSIKIDKIKTANAKAQQKARLEEIRVQKAREKSIDDFNRKEAKAAQDSERRLKKEVKDEERARLEEIKIQKAREKSVDDFNKKEAKAAKDTERIIQKSSKDKEKARLDEIKLQKAREKSVDDLNKKDAKAAKEAQRILKSEAKAREKAGKARITADKKAISETNKKVKASIRDRKATINQADAGKRLNKQVREARKRLRRLTLEYGKNNAKTIRATRNYDRLERKQRELNATVRRGTKSMKLFGLSFNTVRGSALKFGVAMAGIGGGFAIFRNAFNTVKDFEQGQADLASILEVNVKGMKGLTDQSKKLGATTTFTATEVAGLQKEFAKLGFTQKEIQNVTKATLLLAEATGTDLARAAEVTGGIINSFGLDAKNTAQVVDVMAKSFSSSGLDMEKFAETMKTAAPIAKITGISLETATAAAGVLADNMISGSKAGTDLKRIFSELAKDGKPLSESLDDIAVKLDAASSPAEKLAIAEGLVQERAKGALLILVEQRDALVGLKDKLLDAEGAAEKMAETQRKTLGGALKLLSSAWDGYILKVNESTGASNGLKNVVVFLSENLETIVNTLFTVVKMYALYRIALAGLKLNDHIKDLRKYNKGLKASGKATGELSKGAVKLKRALKGIGFAVAITLALELVSAFIDMASGASDAREAVARLDKQLAKSNKQAEKILQGIRDRNQEIIDTNRELLSSGDITLAQFKEIQKALNDNTNIELKNNIKIANGKKQQFKDLKEELELLNQASRDRVDGFASWDALQERIQEVGKELGISTDKILGFETGNFKLNDVIGQLDANIGGINARLELYHSEIDETTAAQRELRIENNETTKSIKEGSKAIEEQTSLLREITDERLSQIKDAESREVLQAREAAAQRIEDLKGDAEEVATLTKLIEKSLRIEIAAIRKEFRDEEIEAEKEAREAAETQRLQDLADEKAQLLQSRQDTLNEFKLQLLESNKEEAEINEDFLRFEIEQLQKRTDLTVEELITLEEKKRQLKQLELAEERAHQDELLALRKKVFDKLDEFAQKALDKQIERSQAKQELLEKEISNSQKLEDRLRESAQNQNAVASESLAVQSNITEEKERAKIKEAKKEANIEELKALWKALNSFLDQGDNILQAGGKSTAGVGLFKKLFNSLTGFKKGTKGRLGDEHTAQFSGVDGHVVRLDKREGVAHGDHMDAAAAVGLTTMDSIFNSAIMNQQLVGVPMANRIDDRIVVGGNSGAMEKKLDTLIDITKKNKPAKLSTVMKRGLMHAMVEEEEVNGKLIRKWTHRR